MIKCVKIALIAGLLALSHVNKCYGWCAVAHYELTKAATGDVEIAKAANLPDYTPSNSIFDLVKLDVGNVPQYFCWAHGVVYKYESDKSWLGINCPKAPWYSWNNKTGHDGRYQGPAMWEFLKNKIDQNKTLMSPYRLNQLKSHIKGFRAHNAADKIVHWDFFKGDGEQAGISNNGRVYQGLVSWSVHHGGKEYLADYLVYMIKHKTEFGITLDLNDVPTNPENAFEKEVNGNTTVYKDLKQVTEYQHGLPIIGKDSSGGWEPRDINNIAIMMNLAQKIYRKNCRNFDDVNDDYTFRVEDIDTGIIGEYKKNIYEDKKWDELFNKEKFPYYGSSLPHLYTDEDDNIQSAPGGEWSTHWEAFDDLIKQAKRYEVTDDSWELKEITKKFTESENAIQVELNKLK